MNAPGHICRQRAATLVALAYSTWLLTGGIAMAAENPNQPVIDQAAATKAVADAQAAAANALKAQYDAEAAAAKAKYGDIPSSGYGGAATASTGAGGAEGTLLGAKALQQIAKLIAKQVQTGLGLTASPDTTVKTTKTVLLFGSLDAPNFQALTAFKVQSTFLVRAFDLAKVQAPPLPTAELESVAALGFGLDALSKLLSYAKADYSFAALDIAGTDAMLVHAVAQELPSSGVATQLPVLYSPDIDSPVNQVFADAAGILTLGVNARKNQRDYEAAQKKAEEALAADPNNASKKAAVETAKAGAAVWKNMGDTIDAWSKQSSNADDKGNVPLATVIRQASIKQKLDNGAAMLVLQVHKAAGTSYTKKSLLSSIGFNPFFVMGGAVAGFTLLDGKDGHVLAAGLLPWHGGYLPVDNIQAKVNTQP